jgi:hypothetical protein
MAFRALIVFVALLVFSLPAWCQAVPPGATTMTANELSSLRMALEDLQRGDCKGMPHPPPNLPDTRVCEPFKGMPVVTMAIDFGRIDEILNAYQKSVAEEQQRILRKSGSTVAPVADGTPVQKQEYQKRLDDFSAAVQEMANAPHVVVLEHFSYDSLNVGDPPKNPVTPSDLGTLSKWVMDGMAMPAKAAPTASALPSAPAAERTK